LFVAVLHLSSLIHQLIIVGVISTLADATTKIQSKPGNRGIRGYRGDKGKIHGGEV
jgi:hypothetical protein